MSNPSSQGQNDAARGLGPAQTHNWDWAAADQYHSAYRQQQEQQNKK